MRTNRLLFILLVISVLLHIWIADFRHASAPEAGTYITAPPQWKDSNVKKFRVSTYNIRRAKGEDGVRDISRSAGVIRGADIVGLNELSGTLFYDLNNQAQQLGELLEMGWLFAPTEHRWYQDYFGNGLLSRFPVSRWIREPLLAGVAESRHLRNMITATIQINGTPVTIMITHLDRGDIREQQVHFVLQRFELQSGPVSLMGDLNTTPDNTQLTKLFLNPDNVDAVQLALGNQLSKRRLDWIITRGFRVIRGGMIPGGISDHPNFWVDLEFLATSGSIMVR